MKKKKPVGNPDKFVAKKGDFIIAKKENSKNKG